jgi:acetyl esterase/lipase
MTNAVPDRICRAVTHRRQFLALMFLMASSRSGSSQVTRRDIGGEARILRAGDTIGDLLRHPAFAGFARKLLPWDERAYDEQMKLNEIGSLLPYHTHVDVASVLQALNRMIVDASRGRQIHFNIYTEAEQRQQPAKKNTGLFFYRGQAGAPFAIIAPGGGFAYVGSVHEGFPYAAEISRAGFNAFVLKYRAGQGEAVATQDLGAAITFVFRNADALSVSTRGYSLWGSSAGARMAASIGSHGVARFGGGDLPKPSAVVMAYTAHSEVSDEEPPTFAVVGALDGTSPPRAMERRITALRRTGAEVDYRVFERIGHGFGPGIETSAEGWIEEAIRFWQRHQPR